MCGDNADLAVKRAEAFAAMELARAQGNFVAAQEAKDRLEALGIKVRYARRPWPRRQAPRGCKKSAEAAP